MLLLGGNVTPHTSFHTGGGQASRCRGERMGQAPGEPAGPEALMAAEAVQGRVCFFYKKKVPFSIEDSSPQQASAVIVLILCGCRGAESEITVRRMWFLPCRPRSHWPFAHRSAELPPIRRGTCTTKCAQCILTISLSTRRGSRCAIPRGPRMSAMCVMLPMSFFLKKTNAIGWG
jgi:hypothetical protein